MDKLLQNIKGCTLCKEHLPYAPKPVLQVASSSKIIIIGQAPGQKAHNSGIPWDDASGNNLRNWLGINKELFYDAKLFALIPMGFCFPGTGKSGDLPPKKECAITWHQSLFDAIEKPELVLLIGKYAHVYYLKGDAKATLTETVKNYKDSPFGFFPLPHPSPRNNIWLKRNSWFESDVLPLLKQKIKFVLSVK